VLCGVSFIDDEVVAFRRRGDRITEVDLAKAGPVSCGQVVNACGTRAAGLMQDLGEEFPVEPRKRTVFVIDAPNASAALYQAPLLIDHTGFYLRPEGKTWIVATVPDQDGPCDVDDFEPALGEFEDVIWPKLYARAPVFDAVKVMRAWAGQYDYNRLDQNAVVGLWPGLANLYVLNGFSGHGLQQSPAMGRGLAELMLTGRYQTLDLSPFNAERLATGSPFLERAIV
jgi:glycine/D-amino acid oxidase-like deaminating enzyme